MKEPKKSNRVSWASGGNLCQVKIFQSADLPSKVGLEAQDHPQLEASHLNIVKSDGYPASYVTPIRGRCYTNPLGKKISYIPQIQWKTPPEFVLKSDWHVAAGEESKEANVQKSRETSVLEAVYPRLSAIPPSPFISWEVKDQGSDDRHTPVIPIIPIEEAAIMDLPSLKTAPVKVFMASQQENLLTGPSTTETLETPHKPAFSPEPSNHEKSALVTVHGLKVDPVVAAAAAATAIMKSKEPGSLIDPDLLIKFLSNPKMTQELINEHGLATVSRSGTSELKEFEPRVSLPSSGSNLLIKNFNDLTGKYADTGTQAIHRQLAVKQSLVVQTRNTTMAATVETGRASGPKPAKSSVSLLNSVADMLVKESADESIPPEKTGNIAANSKTGTASGAKRAIPSVSLPSLTPDRLSKKTGCEHGQTANSGNQTVSVPVEQSLASSTATEAASKLSFSLSSPTLDFMSKKSTVEDCQVVNTGYLATSKPVIQSLAITNSETGTGSKPKPGSPFVTFPSSTPDLWRKTSTSEHCQPTSNGNVVWPMPVAQSLAARTETGSGSGRKGGPLSVPLPSSNPDLLSVKSRSEHSVLAMAQNVNVPQPVKQSLAANTMTGTGFRPMPTTPSLPISSSMPEFLTTKPTGEHHELTNIAVRGPATENHPLPMARMKTELLVNKSVKANGASHARTADSFGSMPVTISVPLMRPELDISRVKKLIDEHGVHNRVRNAYVTGIKPLIPNQSRSDMEMIKTMISEYGSHDKLKNPLPGMEPLLAPLHTSKPDILAPLGENMQPTEILPAGFCAPTVFIPVPLQKDLNYYKSLIKQHGEKQDDQWSQYNKSPNYIQGLETIENPQMKNQKPCVYFNSSKGCRNGSKCPYLHDMYKHWRSGGVLQAPSGKRMKLGEELRGWT